VTSFEQRLAAMEGTEAAIATSSGMAAILLMCMGLLRRATTWSARSRCSARPSS
jgi:O-acetylhomoserine/O-acetylserine sulfhydrylase-like pyridoxal-dependent enzyme